MLLRALFAVHETWSGTGRIFPPFTHAAVRLQCTNTFNNGVV
jgi:hypothetical protein